MFMARRTITLFGGTFDPIHLGHTTVARAAAELIRAEKIIFIPAKRSPLKGFLPRASDEDRLQMITLAIADEERFEVSDYELSKPAPSYTLETVRRFQKACGADTSIHWLIGADGIDDLITSAPGEGRSLLAAKDVARGARDPHPDSRSGLAEAV